MEQNLLEEVETYFTEDTVSQASAVVGEGQRGVEKAVARIISLVISVFIGRAERPGGIEALWQLTRATADAGLLPGLLTAEKLKRRTELMQGLLGEEYGATVQQLAQATQLKSTSVETLLSMTAQAVLQSLGDFAHEKALDATALFSWLEEQKAGIRTAVLLNTSARLPAATPASALAGHRPVLAAVHSWEAEAGTTAPPTTLPALSAPMLRWALLLLVVMAGAVLEYLFVRNRFGQEPGASIRPVGVAAAPPADSPPPGSAAAGGRYDAATDNYIYDPGRPITLTLVDGTTQTVGVNSTENRLYTFLADASVQVDPVNRTKGWINFDRVYFDTKKARLTDESRNQLRNVASILQSFPAARVKIGGYSDTTGTVLANLRLSEDRANAAMSELVSMGIALSRIEAKGYGGKHGIADNTTPVGRALNRRISIRVTRK